MKIGTTRLAMEETKPHEFHLSLDYGELCVVIEELGVALDTLQKLPHLEEMLSMMKRVEESI